MSPKLVSQKGLSFNDLREALRRSFTIQLDSKLKVLLGVPEHIDEIRCKPYVRPKQGGQVSCLSIQVTVWAPYSPIRLSLSPDEQQKELTLNPIRGAIIYDQNVDLNMLAKVVLMNVSAKTGLELKNQ